MSLPVSFTNFSVSVTASSDPSRSAIEAAALPSLHLSTCLSLSYLGQSNKKWCTVSGVSLSHCRQFGVSLRFILCRCLFSAMCPERSWNKTPERDLGKNPVAFRNFFDGAEALILAR